MRLRSATTQPHFDWTGVAGVSECCQRAEFNGPKQEGPHAAKSSFEKGRADACVCFCGIAACWTNRTGSGVAKGGK